MVLSSKKKRGKRRKAAKNAAAANSDNNLDDQFGLMTIDKQGNKEMLTPSKFIEFIQMGQTNMTEMLSNPDIITDMYGRKQIMVGAVPAILGFLQRCEDETFKDVNASVANFPYSMETPSLWIKALSTMYELEPSCRIQISRDIGPLVRCMCNDTVRLFFKSNKHWTESIESFVGLIDTILMDTCSRSNGSDDILFDTALQHEGLLRTIIQWGFWDDCRPDITKVLETNTCTKIVNLGRCLAKLVILDGFIGPLTEEHKRWLLGIGTTPIISKQYDPNSTISYVEGLIRKMKTTNDIKFIYAAEDLVVDADCVDKGVITELISYGISYASIDRAAEVLNMSVSMLFRGINYSLIPEKNLPNDTRTAFAIRAGLLDMCLTFVENCWRGSDNKVLFNKIGNIFSHVNDISLHKKTAKAIRSKRRNIEEKLARLEQNIDITTNPRCKKLLDMTGSILGINGSYCCRCNKSLSKTEVKLCNGCGCMAYCSRACQKEDWQNGRKLACCKSFTEQAFQFQGRLLPEEVPSDERAATQLNSIEINMNMIQLKLFLDNAETILGKASALDIPIYDCVVSFDLRKCPPTVDVVKYTEIYDKTEVQRLHEDSTSNTCVYIAHFGTRQTNLQMRRLFPHAWLYLGKDTIDTSNDTTSKRRVVKVSSRWRSVNKKASGEVGMNE